MSWAYVTYAQFRQELANALNDSGKVFWTDGELKVHVQLALMFWNALTGMNRVWYDLDIAGGTQVWYDLSTLTGSPRQATTTDVELYSWLQYALVEAQSPANAALSSGQYSTDQLVQSLNRARDEFLFRSAMVATVNTFVPTPNVQDQPLSPVGTNTGVVLVRRGYWLPGAFNGAIAGPIYKSDDAATAGYARTLSRTPGNPYVYSAGVEPIGLISLVPPPGFPGTVELLTVEAPATLPNPPVPPTATLVNVPNDFAPALYWRVLADLMDMNAECRDQERAKYARARFEQFIELGKGYPFVLSTRYLGQPLFADAVENYDGYTPQWEASLPPTSGPEFIAFAGSNLVACPANITAQVPLYLVASAALPVNDTDFIQLPPEVYDAVLGYAQHEASFKMGWYEFSQTFTLFEACVKLAATYNAKVRAMSTFRDLLYGRATREDLVAPRELAPSLEDKD